MVNIWVRIFELLMEYFHESIIEDIALPLGHLVNIDERTRNREMCYYAWVLVELDLWKDKEYHIMYERSGHNLISSVGYELHPEYCIHCQIIGHSIANCRTFMGKRPKDKDNSKPPPPLGGDQPKKTPKEWTRKVDQPSTSNNSRITKDADNHGTKDKNTEETLDAREQLRNLAR